MPLITYLFTHSIYRIIQFFEHWYLDSLKVYTHFVISKLEKFDRVLAFKITLRYIFEPLYQDRSFIGYILGFIFRSMRLLIGGVVYIFVISIAIFLYLVWLLIPIFIIYKITYEIGNLNF